MNKFTIFGLLSIVISILLAFSLLLFGSMCDLISPNQYCSNYFFAIALFFVIGIILFIISLIKRFFGKKVESEKLLK